MQKYYLNEMTGHGPFTRDEGSPRPNIILISLDMVPVEFHLDLRGHPEVDAPALGSISNNHISFSNAFSTSPLCSPSRAAYLSGRHSYITTNAERAHDGHAIHVRDDDILFPEYLKAVGYHVRHVGKSHVGAGKFIDIFGENDAPWDRWSPPWYDDDDYIAFLRARGLDRIEFDRPIVGRGPTGRGSGNSYGGWIADQRGTPFPMDATYPAFLVDRAIGGLESRRDPDAPFYLQLDFFGPHQPFAIPSGMEEREKQIRSELTLPDSYLQVLENGFDAPWPEPRVYRIYRRSWGLQDPQTVLDYMVANQLQYELIDATIGKLFAYLQSKDLYDDTWIFVIADHGEMNGHAALVDKGAYLNPRVIRVPILIRPPRGDACASQSVSVDTPVSLLDIAPTVLSIAGIATDARMDGVSLLKTLEGVDRPPDRPILCEIWSHVIPNPCIGMVFQPQLGENCFYTFNASDEVDELYRLDGRGRMANLCNDSHSHGLQTEAIVHLHRILKHDSRWKSYAGFMELTYPELLTSGGGDRQLFV